MTLLLCYKAMPQFLRRNTQPMRPEAYRRIARQLHEIADAVDLAADGLGGTQRATLNARLQSLHKLAAAWWRRHQTTTGVPHD